MPLPASIPDTETLRRRALEASWRRDRVVGRRRLALRWALWSALRFGLPLAVGMGLLWLALQPERRTLPPEAQPINLKITPSLNSKEAR